jgi:DNA-directed RNA polymerase specialized sigma24 family protein
MNPRADDCEDACIERARKGDGDAFGKLVTAQHKALIGFIRARMPGDLVDAEVVAQKVWIAVWEDLRVPPEQGGFDPEKGSFQAFVRYRHAQYILRREIAANAKKRARETSLDERQEEYGPMPAASRDAGPAQSLQTEEFLRLRLAAFKELFRILFLCGGYPHQQLAVAFSKYLYGACADRVQRVHQEHGATPLCRLVEDFTDTCRTFSELPDDDGQGVPRESLSPLLLRLPLTVSRLMDLDKASRDQFATVAARRAGDTCLGDYYADRKGGFTAAIPDWCYKVEKRVRQLLGVEETRSLRNVLEKAAELQPQRRGSAPLCRRCKLRALPPCEQL